jgi:alkylhydroperoxidase/carboxymuconolactone decarboxylase family protein YurZ
VVGTIVLGAGFLAWTWVQHWPFEAAPQTWRRVEPHFEPRTEEQPPSDRLLLLRQIEQLETDLKEARREANALRAVKERLERDLQSAKAAENGNRTNPLFRRVGLDESVPEWIAVAARRAYRSRLHPDVHPTHRKAEAERRFKLVEEIFAEIWRIRGFRS